MPRLSTTPHIPFHGRSREDQEQTIIIRRLKSTYEAVLKLLGVAIKKITVKFKAIKSVNDAKNLLDFCTLQKDSLLSLIATEQLNLVGYAGDEYYEVRKTIEVYLHNFNNRLAKLQAYETAVSKKKRELELIPVQKKSDVKLTEEMYLYLENSFECVKFDALSINAKVERLDGLLLFSKESLKSLDELLKQELRKDQKHDLSALKRNFVSIQNDIIDTREEYVGVDKNVRKTYHKNFIPPF
ncbi:MAG: hypothetical protein QF475_00790 [Candidatus Undinarchaeales archaeon]|jgi:hypothetical protein|nr:hypothetical protein [Candidatus Undinarchaeales archaeon]